MMINMSQAAIRLIRTSKPVGFYRVLLKFRKTRNVLLLFQQVKHQIENIRPVSNIRLREVTNYLHSLVTEVKAACQIVCPSSSQFKAWRAIVVLL
ncbi:unnamed protein product, partial [Iphiclides podalirius]